MLNAFRLSTGQPQRLQRQALQRDKITKVIPTKNLLLPSFQPVLKRALELRTACLTLSNTLDWRGGAIRVLLDQWYGVYWPRTYVCGSVTAGFN